MKIAIGSDHAGFELKEKIKRFLAAGGWTLEDQGTHSTESVDYPDYAQKVGEAIGHRRADLGILVCGSGIGMAMAANKVPGIRAAHVNNVIEAQLSREHNNANLLALGARFLDEPRACEIVSKWLATPFAAGRHQQRVKKITELEEKEAKAARASHK